MKIRGVLSQEWELFQKMFRADEYKFSFEFKNLIACLVIYPCSLGHPASMYSLTNCDCQIFVKFYSFAQNDMPTKILSSLGRAPAFI